MENTLIHCCISIGIVSWITISSFLVIDAFHHTPLWYGFIQAFIFAGYTLGCRLVQKNIMLMDKTKLIYNGLIVINVSALSALFVGVFFPNFLFAFILTIFAYALGGALMFGALNRSAVDACNEPMGARLSIFSSLISLAIVCGSTFASLLYNGTTLSIACVLIAVSILACLLKLART